MGLFINNDEIKRQEEEERKRRAAQREQQKIAEERASELSQSMLYTTGYNFDGYHIAKYKGVCFGNCILGMGVAADLSSVGTDFTGNKNHSMTIQVKLAQEHALKELLIESSKLGGNAIIGVEFNVYSITTMIGVTVTGTSVIVEKE